MTRSRRSEFCQEEGRYLIWTVLKVVGIVLLLFVAYVAWVLFRASSTIGKSPAAHSEMLSDRIRVTVSFPGADSEFQITQVLVSREIGEELGIAAPHGFRIEPYTLDDMGDPASEDSAEWAAEANSKDIRWVGTLPLAPDAVTTLDFPIQKKAAGEIVLRFQYERKIGMSGQISFFSVPVEATGT